MLAIIKTAAVCGMDSVPVDVEVDVAKQSFPAFTVVGLPDKAIDEAKERVRAALKNSGAEFPQYRITVNLAPADLPKNGPSFDLPIGLGLLLASEQISCDVEGVWLAGELSLDGRVRPVHGVLAIAALAKQQGAKALYVASENAAEASLIAGLTVYGVGCFKDLALHLTGSFSLSPSVSTIEAALATEEEEDVGEVVDMKDILGQEQSKRALEIAAAGGHNVLLQGLPGSGKTLLARSFPSILPPLTLEEALEVSTIYSVAGMLGSKPLLSRRPFRAPHHTTSSIGLIGGGANPRPGEVSLAHRGVLFLDEFAEFPRHVLEVLRQPLEDGVVSISRAKASYTYPARFQLLAAQNPCPCGHLHDPEKPCICTARQISAYQKRISGPLLDRFDIFIQVPRVERHHFKQAAPQESSAEIVRRVKLAREKQQVRFSGSGMWCNAEMKGNKVREWCQLPGEAEQLMQVAVTKLGLSARGYFRIIKVARTIADLANSEVIETPHVAEALQYRQVQVVTA